MAAKQKGSKKKIWYIVVAFALLLLFLAVAIPGYLGMGQKGPDTRTRDNLESACYYAGEVFKAEPGKDTLNIEDLKNRGYTPFADVELTILDNSRASLKLSAQHKRGSKGYVADKGCNIREQPQPQK